MSINSSAKSSTTTRSSVRQHDGAVRTSISRSVAIADASRNSLQGHRTLDEVRDQVAGELAVRALRKAKQVDGVKVGVTFAFSKQNDGQFLRTVVESIQHTLLLQQYLFAVATTGVQKDATANALIICGSSEDFVQRAVLLTSSKFLGRVVSAVNEGVRWVAAVRDMGTSSYDEAALWDVLRKSARTPSDPLSPPPGSLSIAQILSNARSKLQRLTPAQAYNEFHDPDYPMPVFLVDIRPEAQRKAEGGIDGSLIIERNVLEWRFDPRCDSRLAIADRYDLKIIIYCQEGFTSSLAAASLQEMGLLNATDIVGGYVAWRDEGLPGQIKPPSATIGSGSAPSSSSL
jgi:rhodanese-related sulfurtransferase